MEKSFRIHTNIIKDTLLNVNLKQDFDFLEVLSLKLRQKDAYRLHSSNYGVIIGRVLANDAFGIPNAKISVFIERDENDPVDMENVYPYSEVTSKDGDGRRYNLLPDYSDDDCYRVVGTFPQKRYLLDDDIQLEVYDKYYKYTTVTNNAGDYMIFAIPTGSQTVHVDIDLSDIGILSQKPRDFTYRGYDLSEFDSPSQFKESTNLDNLRQIFSQDKSVYVYPFWGDAENGIAAITRCDVQISYKFEPTCVFMGSIVSDNEGNSIGHKCAPNEDNGMNSQLIAGEGTIEMIRKTTDGLVEEFPIQGNTLIDSDGVWCYQIPMNLDYIGTDEYGNIVPTDNPNTGIPTRTQVRFRISKTETGNEGVSKHTAKYLVPMNPVLFEGPRGTSANAKNPEIPMTQEETGEEMEKMYNFGSNTPQSCFRDLYWNNVYSVKNFIPKTQVAHRAYAPNYSALKGANLVDDQNPIPFNKLRIDIPFMYIIVCILFRIVIVIVTIINTIICGVNVILGFFEKIKNISIFGFKPFKAILGWIPGPIGCISLSAGLEEGNKAYFPGCWCDNGLDEADCPKEMENECVKVGNYDSQELKDRIERNLALDFKIVKLDFYQDWINGVLYMPLWYWRKRKKKSYLFGLIVRNAKNEFCSCDENYTRQKTYVTCSMTYTGNSLDVNEQSVDEEEDRWHKSVTSRIWFTNGLIKPVKNKDGLTTYYYTAYNANTSDKREHVAQISQRYNRFYVVRLYATDIILLGNLNEDNYYGIPQLYKGLPSTTANIPLIATVQEDTSSKNDEKTPRHDTSDATDFGTVITTGMDWGHEGADQTPMYGNGLFMDLSCTYADTKAKSCINVERLSELGVNLDMTYNMPYSNNGQDIKYGKINTDGLVTKYELDDMETRAMFATLNHIGFIPQDYQDKIDGYTTQVTDEHTGYLIPKFKYIYPVDFDGRMDPIIKRYTYNFDQASYDEMDEAYLTFRLGAEKSTSYTENQEGRIRHFYFAESGHYEMPLYNNSFYFYFGINKGSTAIDKFNKLFYAPCFQNDKKPFSIDFSTRGRSYCPDIYNNNQIRNYDGYPYIDVKLDDIQIPYSYKLLDEDGSEVISESDMTVTRFIIGGRINDEGNIVSNKGFVWYQKGWENVEDAPVQNKYGLTSGLTNQTYTLIITNANGRTLSEKIEVSIPKITVDYETRQLGSKFYSTATTRIDYICTDETQFYGKLKITGFIVDGYMFNVTSSQTQGYDETTDTYKLYLSGKTDDVSDGTGEAKYLETHAVLRLGINNSKETGYVRECLCDKGNLTARIQIASETMNIAAAASNASYFFADNDAPVDKNTFFIYQPNTFTLTISQICMEDGAPIVIEENTTSEVVTVNNGENFNTYLSGMPVKFMLGSISDGIKKDVDTNTGELIIANQSNFYASDIDATDNGYANGRSPLGRGVSGWYGLHQETTYRFDVPDAATILRNTDLWSDYVDLKSPITSYKSKSNILAFKFNSMFSISKSGYVVDGTTPFSYTARGGVNPILIRSVVPQYESRNFKSRYVLSEKNRASGLDDYPHVIGSNYSGYTENGQKPQYNPIYSDREVIGNYFAAFTQNGGYSSSTAIDTSIKVIKIPNYTKVTPRDGNEKVIGVDEVRSIANYRYAFEKYKQYQPYLRSLFVDRRLDFNLVIFAPVIGDSFNLYPQRQEIDEKGNPVWIADDREKIWKSARISGWTYNGIEMSYDEDYNIISADTRFEKIRHEDPDTGQITTEDGYASGATPNKRLEYSYIIQDDGTDGDAVTYYNTEKNMIWPEDTPVAGKEQIVKRYYSASFGGTDISKFFWSTFNENRLNQYISTDNYNILNNAPYAFSHPPLDMKYGKAEGNDGYNGDFNMENVISGVDYGNGAISHNYPTVRAIDICNVTPSNNYELDILPCSYNIKATRNEDGTITCRAKGDDGLSYEIDFMPPITFLTPNDDSSNYCNAEYHIKGDYGDYKEFTARKANLYFKYNVVENDNFEIYTSVPRVIRVLPYYTGTPINGQNMEYDGISYIKTTTSTGEIASDKELDDLLRPRDDNNTVIYYFRYPSANYWGLITSSRFDIFTPSNITIDDWLMYKNSEERVDNSYFFYNRDTREYITSDCEDFENIRFRRDNIDLSTSDNVYASVFNIVVDRRCFYINDDGLKRRLRLVEFGETYDCRRLLLRINQDADKTYVWCTTGDTMTKNVQKVTNNTATDTGTGSVGVNDEGLVTDPEVSVSVTITIPTGVTDYSGETKMYTQVITFDMLFHMDKDPVDSESQAFANYSMMGYTFRFIDESNNEYDIRPTNITSEQKTVNNENVVIVSFTVRWNNSMGILGDPQWGTNTKCILFAKSQGGFIYKLNEFYIAFLSQDNYKQMEGNTAYPTHFSNQSGINN